MTRPRGSVHSLFDAAANDAALAALSGADKARIRDAVNLMPGIPARGRRVLTDIITHFNWHTHRCDPSHVGLAARLGLSARTVMRAIEDLVARGLLLRERHGGLGQRNSYMPNFAQLLAFEQARQEQARKQRAHHRGRANRVTAESAIKGQACHLGHDNAVNRTLEENQSPEPVQDAPVGLPRKVSWPLECAARQPDSRSDTPSVPVQRPSSRDRERHAAQAIERGLRTMLGTAYCDAVQAITPELFEAAIAAELRQRHAGLALIREQLPRPVPGRDLPTLSDEARLRLRPGDLHGPGK